MRYVTDDLLHRYLDVFQTEYIESVERFVPADLRDSLLRYSLRKHGVRGYVSTSWGTGFEYVSDASGITVVHGSRRVEELLFDAPAWIRKRPLAIALSGPDATVTSRIKGAFPIHLTAEQASARLIGMKVTVGAWSREVILAELFGSRRAEDWSETTALRRAKDEVLVAAFDVKQSRADQVDLGTYLARFKGQTVLVLGDFNHGRGRLNAVCDSLLRAGYKPVLLDQIPEEPNYDLHQKFMAVASVVRFLVFDDTTPSGHLIELMRAEQLRAVVIILREEGSQSSFMTRGAALTSSVVHELTFTDSSLDEVVSSGTAWAERKLTELKQERDDIYPWRAGLGQPSPSSSSSR
jgi:hypothetical protein